MLPFVSPPRAVESEIKIPVTDVGAVRNRVRADGWHLHQALHREVNVLFDRQDGALADRGLALRLRRSADRWTVTFKGPAELDGGVKSREELEVDVDDGMVFAGIMARLEYTPSLRYEKDREVWSLDDVQLALDHTPMGDFVEIEGPSGRLEEVAASLGLDPGDAVTGSYPSLWAEYRRTRRDVSLPEHMIFEAR
jgi:adenylate cyclase class 2